jgi:hypothetical protein
MSIETSKTAGMGTLAKDPDLGMWDLHIADLAFLLLLFCLYFFLYLEDFLSMDVFLKF